MKLPLTSRRRVIKRTLLLTLLSASGQLAHAHAKLIRSEPKASATLTDPPKTIELWFNEILDKEFNSISVFASDDSPQGRRESLTKEKPVVDPKDETHLTLALPPLSPGAYMVEFRVLSRDGHTAPGRFRFIVSQSERG